MEYEFQIVLIGFVILGSHRLRVISLFQFLLKVVEAVIAAIINNFSIFI